MVVKGVFARLVSPVRTAFVVLACASLAAVAGNPLQAQAASSGLAYDEITKFVMGSQGGAQPEPNTYVNGSFAADFQTASNSATPPPAHGLFSMIAHATQMAKNVMNMMKNGTPTSHYFLNGWERTDDPVNKTATIYRSDLHEIINLNLANKTYTITDTNVAPVEETPPPMEPSRPSGPQASPQPGTAKMTLTASTAGLGPKTIDDQPTHGYKQSFKMTVTNATGSCKNGSFETSMTEYISRYPEPTVEMPNGKTAVKQHPAYDPQKMSVQPGCKPTITANTHIGPTPPSGMRPMWVYMNLAGGMGAAQAQNGQQGQGSGSFGFLVERGNVHTLGPADASLFAPPADFTKSS